MILSFVWGGDETTTKRHRVAEKLLHQREKDGGLRLISLQAQTHAFLTKLVRSRMNGSYIPDEHPLKAWMIAQFQSIASLRWGSSHFTWVTSPSKGSWPPLSPILLHICKFWQSTAKLLGPLHELPLHPWKRLSIWGPKLPGVRNITRSAKGGSFARLKDAGVEELGDLTADGTTTLPLHITAAQLSPTPPVLLRAFDRIIQSTPKHSAAYRCSSRFALSNADPITCIKLKDDAPLEDNQLNATHAAVAFSVQGTQLIPTHSREMPRHSEWVRVPVASCWTSQKRPPLRYLLEWENKNSLIASLEWNDQSSFLAAPNATICRIFTADAAKVKLRLQKWIDTHHFDPSTDSTWSKKISTTFSGLAPPRLNSGPGRSTLSTRRSLKLELGHRDFAMPSSGQTPPPPPPTDICKAATQWWENWRVTILWTIWSQRNDRVFRDIQPSLPKATALAWYKLIRHTRRRWKRHHLTMDSQDLTLAERAQLNLKAVRKLAIHSLRLRVVGLQLYTTWRPP
ncbi:hypothetical protein R1sor_025419 [Riccia sorocarpa]|uniref:Reverse transcriptase n=1 Tax=Riccia sorocarpa TaxID=122646 RepID=A0ABD3G9X7_9MARC